MEAKYQIREGDKVHVYFENVAWFEGVVRCTPGAPGEAWVIEAQDGIRYVQNYAMIVKSYA